MSEERKMIEFESEESRDPNSKWRYRPYSTSSSEEEELDQIGPLVEPDATFIGGLKERTLKIRAVSRNGGNLDDFLSVTSPLTKKRKRSENQELGSSQRSGNSEKREILVEKRNKK
jgi:hypothetical protein